MSVTFQTLVVFGWDIGYEQYEEYDEEDGWQNVLEQAYGWRDRSEGDIAIISDGRSGEYCYLGIVTAATNSTRDGAQSFSEHHTIGGVDAEKLGELHDIVDEHGIDLDPTARFHVFTHVT